MGKDLTELTNQELNKQIDSQIDAPEAGSSTEVTPAAPGPDGTPPAKVGSEGTPGEQVAKTKDDAAPETVIKPAAKADELKFAGKYKTAEELEKGVNSIVKELSIPGDIISDHIEAAKKSGDWKPVEKLYKSLEAEFTKRKSEESEVVESAEEKAEYDKQLNEWKSEETLRQLDSHPTIKKEIEKLGISFPVVKEEDLRELRQTDPVLYMQYLNIANRIRTELDTWVKERSDLEENYDSVIDKNKKDAAEYIGKLNEKMNLKLTEEQISGFVDRALADEKNFEITHGIKVPKENSFRRYFLTEILPEMFDLAIENAETTGRLQQAKDLKTLQDQVIETASTSSKKKTVQVADTGKPDLTDKKVVKGLSTQQLEEAIREIESQP
jgi:hypothetical protein